MMVRNKILISYFVGKIPKFIIRAPLRNNIALDHIRARLQYISNRRILIKSHSLSIGRWLGNSLQGYNKQNPSLGRPPVEELEKDFQALDLKRDVQLGLLDNRHVLIQISHHEDFLRLYSRPVWYVKGLPMRIFKWTSSFHVDRESPIAPVWVSFPRLSQGMSLLSQPNPFAFPNVLVKFLNKRMWH